MLFSCGIVFLHRDNIGQSTWNPGWNTHSMIDMLWREQNVSVEVDLRNGNGITFASSVYIWPATATCPRHVFIAFVERFLLQAAVGGNSITIAFSNEVGLPGTIAQTLWRENCGFSGISIPHQFGHWSKRLSCPAHSIRGAYFVLTKWP